MPTKVELLIHSAAQLLTCAAPNGPLRGSDQGAIGLIEDGAVAVRGGRITHVGPTEEVERQVRAAARLDAAGQVVLPGFVDAHTHVVFAGNRVDEFEQRVAGATYLEIMEAGGGIMSTVRATRAASLPDLVRQTRHRLNAMLAHGTTTVEAKTGYGLTLEDEMKMLAAIAVLNDEHMVDLVPTFLGAHAIPDEYRDRPDAFVELVVDEMLPRIAVAGVLPSQPTPEGQAAERPTVAFVDVFCDTGAFTVEQSRLILERAQELGLKTKIHVDEFANLGGARLAADLGVTSADHLVKTIEEEVRLLADAGVVGVLLPGTTFGLGSHEYADGRQMVELGLPVALGTDMNPGTCWCVSMPFIIALATRYLSLTPAEAIVAATINAAYACDVAAEVGSLEPGKAADILVLDVPDYRYLAYRFADNPVTMVIKAGKIHEVFSGLA